VNNFFQKSDRNVLVRTYYSYEARVLSDESSAITNWPELAAESDYHAWLLSSRNQSARSTAPKMRPRSAQERLAQIRDWPERAENAQYDSKAFVEEVAREYGISTKSIQRFFRRTFNRSVQAQLDEFRICKVEYLARQGLLAKQILDAVACANASQLSHKFRNARGISFRMWLRIA
jgi:AraC-like DNA-binding protein